MRQGFRQLQQYRCLPDPNNFHCPNDLHGNCAPKLLDCHNLLELRKSDELQHDVQLLEQGRIEQGVLDDNAKVAMEGDETFKSSHHVLTCRLE